MALALAACSTWQAPREIDDSALRARAVTETERDVRLSAAVLSAEDSLRMFGVNVTTAGVQPVWIEVQNSSPDMLWLLRSGTDPDYFSSLEVAWIFHAAFSGKTNARLDEHFDSLSFQNPIPPGAKRSGIIFTNPHRGTRLLNVDLLGQRQLVPFTLFPPVPDDALDKDAATVVKQTADPDATDYQTLDALRAALEQLPCCATGEDESMPGDPINVVLVGEIDHIGAAVVRRGFRREETAFDNAQRLFNRPPDFVVRKAGQAGAPSNWMRLWLAPLRYQGTPVFAVQAGRPEGGRFATFEDVAPQLHPDVDEARNLLIHDLFYSEGLARLGFVGGVGEASVAQPRDSIGGVRYHTDGLRAVMFLSIRPFALAEVELLDWVPALEQREAEAASATTNEQQ